MNESLQYHAAVNRHADFDHNALAELIARHWKQDRSYFRLKKDLAVRSWRPPGGGNRVGVPWSCIRSHRAQLGNLI